MSDPFQQVKVAAMQVAPVFLERKATVEKACSLISEAGRHGAELVVFPEGYIPAHPTWYHHHTATGRLANQFAVELFMNSVVIPGKETDALCKAAKSAGVFVIMGLCEKLAGTMGTMFNTQVFISPEGVLLGKHQKFMPTVGERLVHTGGFGDTFGTFPTRFGNVSGLVCGENSNPLAVFALTTENTRIHGMSWPNYFALTAPPMRHRVLLDSQAFAVMSQAFVISACSVVNDHMIRKLKLSDEDEAILRNPEYTGGSVIVGPETQIIAGPLGNQEEILYGLCDFESTVRSKLRQDFSGHYHRPDIFQLHVNREAPAARTDIINGDKPCSSPSPSSTGLSQDKASYTPTPN